MPCPCTSKGGICPILNNSHIFNIKDMRPIFKLYGI